MPRLRDRLQWDEERGAVFDGDRRYLLMRPDVLMGALLRLDDAARAAWLAAIAASAREFGGRSVQAYAASALDADGLLADTAAAAADLGWGRWHLARSAGMLTLDVSGSPFAEGHDSSSQPLCAPIAGILAALAAQVLGGPVRAREVDCAACAARSCRFEAVRA
jgi:predicted hydrocarbon binding protein